MRSLMPHQVQAVEYLKSHPRAALLLEMRLGKTLICIRYAMSEPACRRILVVAPKTVVLAWQHELNEEGEVYHIVAGSKARRLEDVVRLNETCGKSRVWFLISYGALRMTPELTVLDWDWVIMDESTCIKNPASQITVVANGGILPNRDRMPGFVSAPRRAILSGLVVPESLLELFEQFRFRDGHFLGCTNWFQFRHKYFKPDFGGFDWRPKKNTVPLLRNVVHETSFVLRRKQAGMGSKKVYAQRFVTMPPALKTLYRQAETEFAVGDVQTKWAMVLQTWCGRLAGGFDTEGNLISRHKLEELLYLLQEDFRREQVVVWFHFNAELHVVADELQKAGFGVGRMVGAAKMDERRDIWRRFQDGKLQVLCVQLACSTHGMDYSAADTAIYYSNSYSAEKRYQSEDRLVHPKKDKPLLYIDLVTEDTVDVDAVAALHTKSVNAKVFLHEMRRQFEARLRARKEA